MIFHEHMRDGVLNWELVVRSLTVFVAWTGVAEYISSIRSIL